MKRPFAPAGGGVRLAVKAVPGSSKNRICETEDGRLKIKIAAPAEGGKANEELRSFLAASLGCAKKEIQIVLGEKSRLKTVELPAKAADKLAALI